MNIAFFTDTYLPNTDGVVTAILNYRRELERRGHTVYVFSPGTKEQKEKNSDPHVYYFTSSSFKPYPDYRVAVFNFFSPLKLIKELNIDVIHSHGIATTGLAAIQSSHKLGVPAVATFHTLAPDAMHYVTKHNQLKSMLQGVAWRYLQWYYSSYKKTLAPSDFAKRVLEIHGIKNAVALPGGVDMERFNAKNTGAAARKKLGLEKDEKIILCLGRVALEKNLETVINSAQNIINLVPEARFVIAGKGPAEQYYKDMVKQKGLEKKFLFTGFVEDAIVPSLYSAADVLAFPSEFDTQGLVVLEAMASKTPAVVKKGTAPSEFVKDGENGQVFSDHFDFHDKIVAALKRKEELGTAAAEQAKKYEIGAMTEKLVDTYTSLGQKK